METDELWETLLVFPPDLSNFYKKFRGMIFVSNKRIYSELTDVAAVNMETKRQKGFIKLFFIQLVSNFT